MRRRKTEAGFLLIEEEDFLKGKSMKCFIKFLCIFVCIAAPCFADILNSDFEYSNEPLEGENFRRPTDWVSENYAAVHQSFIPTPEHGQNPNWLIPNNEMLPYQGSSFLVLSTDDIGPDGGENYALANQSTNFQAGQILRLHYFFGTFDYVPYGDFATINLLDQQGSKHEIFKITTNDVGNYGSTDGWQLFEHTFTESNQGIYTLSLEVEDATDAIYKSYFAIDAIGIIPEPATFLLFALSGLILRKHEK